MLRSLTPANVEVYSVFRRKEVVARELKEHFEHTRRKPVLEGNYEELVTSIF
ncbi:MAG: hypothetical protein NVS4B3_27230 [Gemmatimonadaceae bacterium]